LHYIELSSKYFDKNADFYTIQSKLLNKWKTVKNASSTRGNRTKVLRIFKNYFAARGEKSGSGADCLRRWHEGEKM